jgi:hypothetical protein
VCVQARAFSLFDAAPLTRAAIYIHIHARAHRIVSGTLEELLRIDFGAPLHSVVIAGHMHYIEEEMYAFWHWSEEYKQKRREQKQVEQREKEESLLREWQAQKQAEAERKREWEERKKTKQQQVSSSTATASSSSSSSSSSAPVVDNAEEDDPEEAMDVEPF